MMGSPNISKRKKKSQKTLARLKKAAVTIAIFDLILTISDCRNVGRFFLLLTMSSTFDITPENVILDHCATGDNLHTGVCETFAKMMDSGTLLPFPSDMGGRSFNFHPSTFTTPHQHSGGGGNVDVDDNADTEPSSSSYLKATLSIQRLPEMFKELVTSWKSTFDPSRSERNISFYFDDDDEIPQMAPQKRKQQEQELPPSQKVNQYQHNSAAESGSPVSFSLTSLKNPSPSSLSPTRDGKNIPSLNQKRAFPSASAFSLSGGESHEYLAGLGETHLNSQIDHDLVGEREGIPSNHHTTLTSRNDVTKTSQQNDDDISHQEPLQKQHFSKINQEIGSNRKKRFSQPLPQQEQQSGRPSTKKEEWQKNNPISQSKQNEAGTFSSTFTTNTMELDYEGSWLNAFTASKTTPEEGEKINSKSGPTIIPSTSRQTSSQSHLASSSDPRGGKNSDHLKPSNFGLQSRRGGKFNGSSSATTTRGNPMVALLRQKEAPKKPDPSETEGEKCLQSPTISGPKKMIGFLQQEMFGRWQSLLESAGALINPPPNLRERRNLCIGEQLGSPEAGRIKMHIELKPFGPTPYQEAERRVKATQQILFDSPWLSLIQLYSKLSGSFIKMFVVISVYTWVWGTVLGLMLLIGSLTDEPVMIHCWIIFNILYSLLFFMIDDWIHSNINPCRSTVSIWLSISYSLYKPLATWVVLMQWSEMKKSVSNDKTEEEKATPSKGGGGNGGGENSPYLNKPTSKGSPPHSSNPSLSTGSDATKESTIVDLADLNTTDIGPLYPHDDNLIEKESNTAAALMLAVSTLRFTSDTLIKGKQNGNVDQDDDDGGYDEEEDEDDDEGDDDDDDDDTEGEERERGDFEKGSESETTTANTISISLGERIPCGESESRKSSVLLARGRRSNGYVVTH